MESTPDQPIFNVNSSAEANIIVSRKVNCDNTDHNIGSNADKFNQFIDSSHVKSDYVRSGGFASLVYKEQEKISRPLSTNCDLDEAKYHWIEMLDSDYVFAIPSITIDKMRVLFSPAPKLQKYYTVEEAVALCDRIVATGRPYYDHAKIEIKYGMNIPAWRFFLKGYPKEKIVLDGVTYGWLLNWTCFPPLSGMIISNHPTAEARYPLLFQEWTKTQVDLGMFVGPASREQLPWRNFTTVPLHTVDKDVKLGTRRICADPSYTPPWLA